MADRSAPGTNTPEDFPAPAPHSAWYRPRMTSHMAIGTWVFDPEDPRAPSIDEWNAMTPEDRDRVVATLPADPLPLRAMGESDSHYDAVDEARKGLRRLFEERKRSVYVGTGMTVYYPDQKAFAPDIFAVLDVPVHPRTSWVVVKEGRGLDFALEVCVAGDRRKDTVTNVATYARLGIAEYFVFEPERRLLHGHRLPEGGGAYVALMSRAARFTSKVLDLELAVEPDTGRLRFFTQGGALPFQQELIDRLERAADDALAQFAELERALEEERKAREEERKAREEERIALEEERKAREEAERLLAEAKAEIARLRAERQE